MLAVPIVVPVWGLVTVALVGWAVGCVVRWIAWLRLAKRAAGATSGDAIVAGVVVADEPAVVVEITQQRLKLRADGNSWRWEEIDFTSKAQRFALRADSGELIDVVPEDPVLLLWPADHTVAKDERRRTRIARLEHDAHVEVLGWLERATAKPDAAAPYRDGAEATLAAPRGLPMLVSRTPLAPRLRAMGWFQLKRAALLFGIVAIVQTLATRLWMFEIHLLGGRGAFPTTRIVVGIAGAIVAFACRAQQPPWDIGQSADELEPRKRKQRK
jgi:membrane protein implicated in regulation of membrane protease activity